MPIGTSDGKFFDSMDMMFSDLSKAPMGVGSDLELPKGSLQGQVGAKKIGDVTKALALPGDILSGKVQPGSVQEIERAADLAGIMVGGPAPVASKLADGSLGSFAGVRAKTINKDNLYKAQEMEFTGAHPDDIWMQTGFMRGSESRWKYEISPEKSEISDVGTILKQGKDDSSWTSVPAEDVISVKPPRLTALKELLKSPDLPVEKAYTLKDVLNHPELYEAYPHLKDISVRPFPESMSKEYRGMYSPSEQSIFMSPAKPEEFKSTLFHEIQHAIQEYEGFAKGGNPEQFLPDNFKSLKKEFETVREDALKQIKDSGIDRDELNSLLGSIQMEQNGLLKELSSDKKKYGTTVKTVEKNIAKAKELGIYDSLKNIHKSEKLIRDAENKAYEQYRKLAGEIESRNVQARLDYSKLKRILNNPKNFED